MQSEKSSCSIYVGGLPVDSSMDFREKKKRLTEFFSKHGKVERVFIKDNYAFIDFDSEEAKKSALEENGHRILGNTVKVFESQGKPAKKESKIILTKMSLILSQITYKKILHQTRIPVAATAIMRQVKLKKQIRSTICILLRLTFRPEKGAHAEDISDNKKQETKKDLNDSGRSLYYKEGEKYVKVDKERSSERKDHLLGNKRERKEIKK
jgi:hypothetical protein